MSSSIAIDLFTVLEKQIGKAAAAAAMSAYLAGGAAPASPQKEKAHKPWSDETKAKAAEKRAATLAAKKGTEPAPPATAAEPAADEAAQPKRVISDEQKAKMKAGREAALARKKAEAAAGGAAAAAPAEHSDGNESASSAAPADAPKKRGPKPLAEMTPAELAAHAEKVAARRLKKAAAEPLPPSPPKGEDPTEFEQCSIEGKDYLRNCRGDILSDDYDYIGRMEGGKLNRAFPKPADLE